MFNQYGPNSMEKVENMPGTIAKTANNEAPSACGDLGYIHEQV